MSKSNQTKKILCQSKTNAKTKIKLLDVTEDPEQKKIYYQKKKVDGVSTNVNKPIPDSSSELKFML